MIKDVKYKGYTQVPNDYETPDGELDCAIGLVPEGGAIKPVMPALPILSLGVGEIVVYVHDPSFVHYIIDNGNGTYRWLDKTNNGGGTLIDFGDTVVYQTTSVGNTLIILAADGMHYFLWKDDNYKNLGTHIPELEISFGLQGTLESGEEFKPGGFDSDDIARELTDEEKTSVSNSVLGEVNKFIADKVTGEGKFLHSFMVRYAYRLYDGSLTMQSAPVLMLSSFNGVAPVVSWNMASNGKAKVQGYAHSLDYRVLGSVDAISEWKDIVKSVDVYISAPFYNYDQSGKVESLRGGVGYSSIHRLADYNNSDHGLYGKEDLASTILYNVSRIPLPEKDMDETIRSCASFYFLNSIDLDDLKTERTVIEVSKDHLASLVAREVLNDDYDSHDLLAPRHAYPFNARLNIANIDKHLGPVGSPLSRLCFANAQTSGIYGQSATLTTDTASLQVEIKRDGKTYVLKSQDSLWPSGLVSIIYLYHNDGFVNSFYLNLNSSTQTHYKMSAKTHALMNGSVFYSGNKIDTSTFIYHGEGMIPVSTVPGTTANNVVSMPNKIYTSEINNPFLFPLLGVNTVSTGTIIGICAATKALSQGQFGQFPLYAFSSEGVWALETNSDGTYSARQPITRDVCISEKSITQLDNSVLFSTDRGIMMLSGSSATCITDVLDTDSLFIPTQLPKLSQAFNLQWLTHGMVPVKEYIRDARMLYDYEHQRIIVFNNGYEYALVFSLESNLWGMIKSNMKSPVNSYPEALVMCKDNKLYDLSQTNDNAVVESLLVTRPIKLDSADVMKTISAIMQRGYFRRGNIKTVLYGSRDMFNWHIVYSSTNDILRGFRGTPYKYFRIALLCTLHSDESITGCTVQYSTRLENQIR